MKAELEGCGEFADSARVAAQLTEQLCRWLVKASTSGDNRTDRAQGSQLWGFKSEGGLAH
jgi:hypothetical protein